MSSILHPYATLAIFVVTGVALCWYSAFVSRKSNTAAAPARYGIAKLLKTTSLHPHALCTKLSDIYSWSGKSNPGLALYESAFHGIP